MPAFGLCEWLLVLAAQSWSKRVKVLFGYNKNKLSMATVESNTYRAQSLLKKKKIFLCPVLDLVTWRLQEDINVLICIKSSFQKGSCYTTHIISMDTNT